MNNELNPNPLKKNIKIHPLIIVVGIFIVFGIIALIFSGDDEIEQSTNRQVANIPIGKVEVNTPEEVIPEPKVVKPQRDDQVVLATTDYDVVREKDISYALASRYSVDVVVFNNPVTKDQIEVVSEKIVDDFKAKADALAIFFYFDKSQVDGAFTLAKAEWAPNGDWSQANLKKNQRLTYQLTDFIGKTRVNEPTALEREINTAMRDMWYQMMEARNDVTDSEVAKILAPKYGKTPDEMLDIRLEVTSYDLGF